MRYSLMFVLLIFLISCSGGDVDQPNKGFHSDIAGLKWQQLTYLQASASSSGDIGHFVQYLASKGINWHDLVSSGRIFISVKGNGDENAPLQDISPLWEGTWISYHTHLELSNTFPILCGEEGKANMYHEWKYLSRHDAAGCFDDKGHVLNRCLYTLSDRYYVICVDN